MKFGLLTALWVVLMAGVFWKFEGSYLVPVHKASGAEVSAPKAQAAKKLLLSDYKGKLLLINFWNPNCACSEFAEPHVKHLWSEFSSKGVEFVSVVVTDEAASRSAMGKARAHGLPGTLVLDVTGEICQEFGVLAAPAAVIYNRDGQPVYRGAYNIARFCDEKDTAYAEKALAGLVLGSSQVVKSLPFYGCHTVAAK